MGVFRRYSTLRSEKPRIILADAFIAEAGPEESIVLSRLDGSTRRCGRYLAELLPHLDRFRTPGGHAEHLAARSFELADASEIGEALSELRELGLLVDEERFTTHFADSRDDAEAGRIAAVAWITRDRPAALLRSVDSYARRLARRADSPVRLVVVDDTADPERQKSLDTSLRDLASRYRLRMECIGPEEKRRFAERLQAAVRGHGVDPDVVEFALFDPCGMGYTTGANRNALLLATVGEQVLSVDDDTVYDPAELFEPTAPLALSSAMDPTRIEFYPSREKLLDRARRRGRLPDEVDPLAAHGALLGRSVSACVEAAAALGSLGLDDADPGLVSALLRRPHRVAVTSSGSYGDSGMGHPLFVLTLRGEAREAVMRSEETYRSALTSREIIRGVASATITSSPLLMAMTVGLDNRGLLPPFFPVMRNQDEIFRRTLTACSPGALSGFAAEAIFHDPSGARTNPPQASQEIRYAVPRIITTIIQDWQAGRGLAEGTDALEDLGLTLRDVGELSPDSFEEYLRQTWHRGMGQYLLHLEALREHFHGQPDYWDRDVDALCTRTRAKLFSDTGHIPVDVPGSSDRAAVFGKAREVVLRFGALLRAWPAILEASRELRASGEGLGQPLA